MALTSELKITKLRKWIRLGYSTSERLKSQPVFFDISLRFSPLPQASYTDGLEDTICYSKISDWVGMTCKNEYHLIEKLGFETYEILREKINPSVRLGLKCWKESPPLADLEGAASFEISEQ